MDDAKDRLQPFEVLYRYLRQGPTVRRMSSLQISRRVRAVGTLVS